MTSPNKSSYTYRRLSTPTSASAAGLTHFSRQHLMWVVTVSMVLCVFLAWNNKASLNVLEKELESERTMTFNSKAFQVNPKNHTKNYTGQIKQISLIGERNSGTKWMWGHLVDCFNYSVPVEKKFSRYKHWFQPKDYFRYPHDTLVIAEFRNPYDWLLAMQDTPHHMPSHANLEWKEFLTKTWTTPRVGLDLKMKGTEMCQHHFEYKDIISCVHKPEPDKPTDNRYSLDKPFYEMRLDGSGKPYDNIMDMRADKIRNVMEIKDFPGVADLWMVQYEYMLWHGTKQLLDRITEWTGITPQCKPFPPQRRRQRNMTDEFMQYVTAHMNWTTEEWIGYEPVAPSMESTSSDDDDDDNSNDRD